MATSVRRRRPAEDDEEEQTPRRGRRVKDQDDTPRRRRPQPEPDEDDDDEDDVEEAPRSRRSRRDEDEDDRPRRRPAGSGPSGRAGRVPAERRVRRGWDSYNRIRANASDFEDKFKPSGEATVVALLEPTPFHAFGRHWVDLEEGKRAYICPRTLDFEDDDDDEAEELGCPLCDIGHKANSPKAYLNVAVLKPGQRPEHMVWEIGGSISEQLEQIDKGIGKRRSLTDIYLIVSSSGSGLKTKYHVEWCDDEDLDEYDVNPLTDKQRDAFELYDESLYPTPLFRELDKVADEIV